MNNRLLIDTTHIPNSKYIETFLVHVSCCLFKTPKNNMIARFGNTSFKTLATGQHSSIL